MKLQSERASAPFLRSAYLILLAVMYLQSGCADTSNLAIVHGRLMVDGQPIAGAQLLFMPPGERLATGITDEDGYYQLSTVDTHDGAVVGQHLVTIVCRPSIPVEPMNKAMRRLPGGPQMDLPTHDDWVSPIPEKYSNLANPALSIRVNPGDNRIDFDLDEEVTSLEQEDTNQN